MIALIYGALVKNVNIKPDRILTHDFTSSGGVNSIAVLKQLPYHKLKVVFWNFLSYSPYHSFKPGRVN